MELGKRHLIVALLVHYYNWDKPSIVDLLGELYKQTPHLLLIDGYSARSIGLSVGSGFEVTWFCFDFGSG